MDPQMKRGLLEVCVLALLCRGDSYGYQIIKDLSGCVSVSESTLYPILRRLEGAGALQVYAVPHNGRLRKFYSITPSGRAQIRDFLDSWEEIQTMYELIKESERYDESRLSPDAGTGAGPAAPGGAG